ncbi:hypothetical protein [Actinomadura geliboluensis]|uniref:hypothetical protein n=1 Tax=Actinomadura geliboluensis TaxID=882440 RepID=UPI003715DA97
MTGARTLPQGSRIAVVDDDRDDAATWTRLLKDYGFRPEPISEFEPAQSADSFLEQLRGRYDAVVADHVLSGRRRVGFTGAELVCKANQSSPTPLPSVLISSHVNTDETHAIALWRSGIPALVDKSELSGQLLDALELTVNELAGKIARERRPITTPIEILDIGERSETPTAKVIVVGWKIATSVLMPLEPICDATGLKPEQLPGTWLEADVNCYAKDPTDLYFRNIMLAPPLDEDWFPE